MTRVRCVAAAAVVLALAGPGARAAGAQGAAPAPQAPVNITADEAEYFNAENRVVFAGKVVAVQGDATLTADRMEVRFTAPAGEGGAPAPPGGILSAGTAGSRIQSIVSTGNVSFRQVDAAAGTERFATGERGEYDATARLMTLSGGMPRAWEGKDVMTCERMVFSLADHNMKCIGKVEMKVFPKEGATAAAPAGGTPGTPAPAGAPAGGAAQP